MCLKLFAANSTADETLVQGNHCSFARALIERREPPTNSAPSPTCTPRDGMCSKEWVKINVLLFCYREDLQSSRSRSLSLLQL